jgi:hypothetical protein
MKRLWSLVLLSLSFVIVVIVLASITSAPAEARASVASTPICSSVITNTTWTIANSPYVVCNSGSIAVAQGITLTIEPGVEVRFQANARLNVNGTMAAIGTTDRPITFTGIVTTPGSWQGIGIYGTLGNP